MNEDIAKFIKKQHAANICCVGENGQPHCFTCFFAFDEKKALLHYKTSPASNHAMQMIKNGNVAGTILPDKLNMMAVKGLQFNATLVKADEPLAKNASTVYYKKYPFALAMGGEIWTIQLTNIKMTDSGKKHSWQLEETAESI